MASRWLEFVAGYQSTDKPGGPVGAPEGGGYAIAPGVVKNNIDLIAEARVQVRIPTLPAYKPWARIAATGGGSGRGFFWVPQVDDEVLVAFNQNDERDAYILGGLWNTLDRPPTSLPTEAITKKVIRTGTKLTPGLSHEVEFDDARQSLTIKSSTGHKVTLGPDEIELKDMSGTLSITLDTVSQTVSIRALKKLELKAAEISIEGVKGVDVKGGKINVQSLAACQVQGRPIKLN